MPSPVDEGDIPLAHLKFEDVVGSMSIKNTGKINCVYYCLVWNVEPWTSSGPPALTFKAREP